MPGTSSVVSEDLSNVVYKGRCCIVVVVVGNDCASTAGASCLEVCW